MLACSRVSYRTDPRRVEVGARELEVIGHTTLRRHGPREIIRRAPYGGGEGLETAGWGSECRSQRTDRHIGGIRFWRA